MKRLLKIRYIVLASCLAFLFNGCVDDGLGFSADELRDGETTVMLDVSFSPFSEGNLTRANIENGNGKLLSDLTDLCILVYDTEGNLVDDTKYPMKIDLNSPEIKEVNRNDEDASNKKTAETSTKTLSGLPLNLPFGRYYIVAVANLKNGTLETLNENTETIKTLKGLRGMKVEWDNTNTENIKNNSELMGYFTDMEIDNSTPTAEKAFSTVSVNRPGMKLRAWLRRCASKITIDFDGSKLRENVTVYIQKAEIKDIPYDCTLGFGQPSGFDESETSYNHYATDKNPGKDGLIETTPQVISYLKGGAAITVPEGDTGAEFVKPDVTNWAKITKGMSVIKDNVNDDDYETANVINFHSENADALYFYENMQGNPENKTKIPHADLVNGGVVKSDAKDGIKCGTYIEVTGYYESNADGNYSHGNIKYRFMLGKNVTDNFEAERNYHYKLTLCPRGNGNDADWHIEFNEPKGFHVPNPWYVSYLYNHDAMLPFKYTPPEEGWVVKEMTAEIITNPWYPSNFTDEQMTDPTIPIVPVTPSGDESLPYETDINRDNGNGFLSLRAPKEDNVITLKDCGVTAFNYQDNNYATLNNVYYKGGGNGNGVDKSTRDIIKDYQVCNNTGNDRENIEYNYNKDGDSYNINIPLFTRAKVMVKESGYSGNNPFVGYQRIARIRLRVTLEKGGVIDKDSADVNVVQVRRVVNPKGVYRSNDNYSPFHVTMMFLSGDDANATFQAIKSRGPWTAEIIGDKNFITLDGKQKVSGSTDTPIDFSIRFNRMSSSNNKNAVVRVKYHNYTCTHLIFVRQGYDPQALCDYGNQWPLGADNTPTSGTATVWSTFNMIAKNVEATDPRDEGSLFKFGNSTDPIDAVNNAYKIGGKEVYYNLTRGEFDTQIQSATGVFEKIDSDGKLLTGETIKWTDITSNPAGFTDGDISKAATIRDFEQLYLTPNIWFGYGVLYADGATETQSTLDMAYGYYRRDNSSNAKAKGMRGMFAYYWDGTVDGGSKYNGRNVFFPIGRSGYGHRKNNNEAESSTTTNDYGILRYATRFKPASEYSNNANAQNFYITAPLFESIYRRPGGIYWARKTETGYLQWDGTKGAGIPYGLDINYFSFDVNAITGANINNGNDACFVRTVSE